MEVSVLRLVLALLLCSGCAFGKAKTSSCVARLFTTAGLSLSRALETEKKLVQVGLSLKKITRTLPEILSLLLKTTAGESSSISNCIRRKGDACQNLNLCEHGGQCVLEHSAKSYTCRCKENFEGSFCENFEGTPGLLQALVEKVDTLLGDMTDLKTSSAATEKKVDLLTKQHLRKPRSCKEIKTRHPQSETGVYEIRARSGKLITVHCEMEREGGGWTRVLHIHPAATDTCPGKLQLTNPGFKLCTRSSDRCSEAAAQSPSGSYSEVMGFVTGYRDRSCDAFAPYKHGARTVDAAYIDGVSVTRGSPKKHLWSYGASFRYYKPTTQNYCPCSATPGQASPPFVGDHYYCNDLGEVWQRWTLKGPNHLWSRESKCSPGSKCCANNNMPWFIRNLEDPTNDEIQIRICSDQKRGNENVGIDRADFFVR